MNENDKSEYRSVYSIAFIATIAMLVIIPAQILVFAATGIPASTIAWFELFRDNALLGLFHADFFILVNNVLIAIIYLAFYHSLKSVNKGLLHIALTLGFIGIAAYISSNKTFELMSLSARYFAATDAGAKLTLEAAGISLLAGWQGTAFDAYYSLNGVALLIISLVMLKGDVYGKPTAILGLASALLMTVPSTAGTIGLAFSLLSLLPWYVFSVRFAMVFRKLRRG
jgi:Domain of unknown function (DUF4386)